MSKRVVLALGGNAILQAKQEATYENQLRNVETSAEMIAKIQKLGYEVLVTHGNGPQVGNILRQNEEAKHVVPPMPLDVCTSQTQGFIGYMLQQSLTNVFQREGSHYQVATLLTTLEVDPKDEAFDNPTKPIGVFYTKEEAEMLSESKGWQMKEDAGRGYRRVVASPLPLAIRGVEVIERLLSPTTIVVAGGGGGVPVIRLADGTYEGVEAVVDKDRTGRKLAEMVNADMLLILTDVPNACLNYGKENQTPLYTVSVDEMKQYAKDGHFAPGSMGPKVEAAIDFAKQGKIGIICSLHEAEQAILGNAGTRVIPMEKL